MKYKIIVDKQPRSNPSTEKKEYEIDIEELRVKGNVYDSLIITRDEDYVMRRLSLSEYQVLTVLDEPVKEPIPELNIELFEGDNYVYLVDMVGNRFYAEYLIKNDFTDTYVTVNQMNSAITQTAQNIELSVNEKLEGYSTTEQINSMLQLSAGNILASVSGTYATQTALGNTEKNLNASIELKLNKKDVVSEINASADVIRLKAAGRLIIEAGNFQLNEEGTATMKNVIINGGNIELFDEGQNSNPSLIINNRNDINSKSELNSFRLKFTFNSRNGYIYSLNLSPLETVHKESETLYTNLSYAHLALVNGSAETLITANEITTPKLTQTSLKSKKKNIQKFNVDVIEMVRNADICLYNLKGEENGSKKHLGLVIGKGYNCPDIVISENGEGIEQYSYTSLLYKAFQQLLTRVEKLEGVK